MKPSIECKNITLSYHRHPAVHHLTGKFAAGETTALVGPNGAGKSTLLKFLVGIHTDYEGQLIFHPDELKNKIAYLPQLQTLDRNFPITVLDTILMGFWYHVGTFKKITLEQKEQALSALEFVNLKGFEKRNIQNLSNGQLQRVLFARIIVQNASIILLDEPFTGMDMKTIETLFEILETWKTQNKLIIAVLHDLAQVRQIFQNTLLLSTECVAWGKTENVLTQDYLEKAWCLAANWRENREVCEIGKK